MAALVAVLLALSVTARNGAPGRGRFGRGRFGRRGRDRRIVVRATTRSPMISRGVLGVKPAGAAGSPSSAERATSSEAARSQTAEIVSDGLTPRLVGIAEESMQNRPS
ncbi:MAG: hypothetical protein WBQ41_06580 [Solirubrobacterales bacterium]